MGNFADIGLKLCKSCKIEKPKTEYNKRGKGLKSYCKCCISKDNKERYYKDHEETKLRKRLQWHRLELNNILKTRL